MPRDHLAHRRQPGVQPRAAVETQHRRQLVRVALFRQQMVEQDPFLQRRQRVNILHVGHAAGHLRHHRVDVLLAQRRQRQHLRRNVRGVCINAVFRHADFTLCDHRLRQRRQRRCGKQRLHPGGQAGAAQLRHQLHRQQRMAAQLEEVVVPPYPLHPQQLAPDLRQQRFALALRRRVGRLALRSLRLRQRPPVQLAVRRQRQRRHHHPGRRHHVVRQRRAQMLTQRPRKTLLRHARRRHHPGHQPLVAARLARIHHRFTHRRVRRQRRFYLAAFDAEAANFHLLIVAPQVLDSAVRQIARHVAGAVHPPARVERIAQEALRRQLRPVQVAARHLHPADMQLAHRPQRHRLPAFVQQVNPRVGDRPADRHRRQPRLAGAAPGGDVHRRLGRPVQVMQLHLRQPPVERRHQRRRQRFPAAHYPPHLLAARRRPLVRQEALQHRGHEVQRGDAVLGYRPAQVVRILVPLRLRHHQLRPDHQRPEELPHRHVEAERRFLQHPVLRRQAVGLLHPQQPVDHPAVFVHRPLRLAGRPRGVNHVRQVRRLRPRLRVVAAQLAWQRLVQRQLRHLVRRQRRPPGGVRQQQQRLGILQDVLQALARVGRIQRHVGAAGLEDAKQRGDHRQAALGAHRHPAVRPHAAGDKPMRQPVGAGVQLGVAQAFPAADHRHRLRGALHLLLEQRLQRLVQRVVPAGVVPAVQQMLALGHRQQIDMGYRLLVIQRHGPQRLQQVNAVAFGGGAIEQRGGEVQRAADVLAGIGQIERQIELRRAVFQSGRLRPQAGQRDIAHRTVLPGQHRLEQRGIAQVARRIHLLHHLLERQVAVFLRRQHRAADPFDQRRQARIVLKIDAQRQRTDEEADQRLGFQPAAVGLRRADHQLPLPGHARQHQAPGRQHRHEQRGAVLPAELPQRLRQLGVDDDRHLRAAERLHRRARPVGRQRQQRRRAAQGFAPVLRLRRQPFRRQVAALPGGVVRVLQRQRRQRIGFAVAEGAVQGAQFAQQNAGRPAVGNDVVAGEQEQMLFLRQADQRGAHQRALRQIERFGGRLPAQRPGALGLTAQIVECQRQPLGRQDMHLRPIVLADEPAAQRFVASIERVQTLLQRLPVQPPAQAQRQRDVIGFAHAFQLGQEPQALLGERQRQRRIAGRRLDRRQRLRGRRLQRLRQQVQHRLGEQRPQRQQPSRLLHPVGQPHRHQRVPAQLEEAVVTANALHAQQFAPNPRQQRFRLALRRNVGFARAGADLRRRQGAFVQFSVAGQRQRLQPHIGHRHHIIRQARLQMLAQPGRQRAAIGIHSRHHPGHQPLAAVAVVNRVDRNAPYPRIGAQLRLHLATLDAETADLHLLIVAPQILEVAIRQIARQIAGAVHARARGPVERILEEAFRRQLRPIQVAARHAFTADVQLADRPHRHRLAVGAQQVEPQIGNAPADRAGGDRRVLRRQRAIGDVYRGLGNAVHVDQLRLPLRIAGEPRRQIGRLQHFAAKHDVAQPLPLVAVGLRLDKGFERAGRLVQYRNAAAADEAIKIRRRAGDVLRHDEQLPAVQQGAPNLPDREIKGERVEQAPFVGGGKVEPAVRGAEQPRHLAMLDHHPFGFAGRAGGVDHIRQMRRPHPGGLRIAAFLRGQLFQRQHRQRAVAQRLTARGVRQQQHRRGVRQDILQALPAVGRIQRHVSAAGLKDPQQADQHRQAAFGAQRHQAVRLHALPHQAMRPAISPVVQFGIAQALGAVHQRRGVRRALHLGFELLMQAERRRVRNDAVIEAVEQQFALFGGDQAELADGATVGARFDRVIEQHQQVLGGAQHLFIGHRGGVVHPAESAVGLADLQHRARTGRHDGGDALVFRPQPLLRPPADDRHRRRPGHRGAQLRIARQQRGVINRVGAQLRIFLLQRVQRLLEVVAVIDRNLQRQRPRAQRRPTPPVTFVRDNPAKLKIGFVAHARQIKGRRGQHLLAGYLFQPLPRRRLPARRPTRLAPRPRRERRRIKARQARLPECRVAGAGAIRRAKLQRFGIAQQRQNRADRQTAGLSQRIARQARAVGAQEWPGPHHPRVGGDVPAVGVDPQQGAGRGCPLGAQRLQRRQPQCAVRQQNFRLAADARAMAQRADHALQRLRRAIPANNAAGRRLAAVGVKTAAGVGLRQRRHLLIQRRYGARG
ncbi:Uncharacterised protein [Serratia ficaria]|nr:Uncharacterised protein [Serratia ficaria]